MERHRSPPAIRSLFLFYLCARLVRSTDPPLSPKGLNYEVAALMSVKSKMRDETGVMDGWDINSVDPCTWSMVGCSPDGFVISLEMGSHSLSGVLSPSVGNLSHLQTMLLRNNRIYGAIPFEIGRLSKLKTLDLSGNQFVGEIPGSLGLLTQLGYLRLDRNNLSGQIPVAVANLAGLSFLDLSLNNLSGPTPKILAKDYRDLCFKQSALLLSACFPIVQFSWIPQSFYSSNILAPSTIMKTGRSLQSTYHLCSCKQQLKCSMPSWLLIRSFLRPDLLLVAQSAANTNGNPAFFPLFRGS